MVSHLSICECNYIFFHTPIRAIKDKVIYEFIGLIWFARNSRKKKVNLSNNCRQSDIGVVKNTGSFKECIAFLGITLNWKNV